MDESPTRPSNPLRAFERAFEHFLWYFRVVIVLGVVGLVLGSSIVFIYGIIETFQLAANFVKTMLANGLHLARDADLGLTYNGLILGLVTVVDDFLIGIVLLIFGLGSYDLFISRIDAALDQNDIRPDWLVFGSLEELKSVLGKVVLMILTINFLQITINTRFDSPLHLVYLGAGIALVSLGLKLTHGPDIEMTKAVLRHDQHGKPGHGGDSGSGDSNRSGRSRRRPHTRQQEPAGQN